MDWAAFCEWFNNVCLAIKDFFNQPVPIIGCTIGFLVISILSILSKTSLGKKTLNKALTKIDAVKAETTKKIAFASTKINELEEEYKEKLAIAETHSQELEELLLNISEQLHNKKIAELVENYRNAKVETKTAVENIVDKSSRAIDEKLKEITNQMNEYKAQLEESYKEMLENYETELKELQEKLDAKKELTYEEQSQANE